MLSLYLDPHSGSNFCLFKKICLNQGLSLKTACGQKSLFGQMLQNTCKVANCSFEAMFDISIRARIGVIRA